MKRNHRSAANIVKLGLFMAVLQTGCSGEVGSMFKDVPEDSGSGNGAKAAYKYVVKLGVQPSTLFFMVTPGALDLPETEAPPRLTGEFHFSLKNNVKGDVPMDRLKAGTFVRYHMDGTKFPLSFQNMPLEQVLDNKETQYLNCNVATKQETSGWVNLDCLQQQQTEPFKDACQALAERSGAKDVTVSNQLCSIAVMGEKRKVISARGSDPEGLASLKKMVRQMAFMVDRRCGELPGGKDYVVAGTNQFYCGCFKDGDSANGATPEKYFYADYLGDNGKDINKFGETCLAPVKEDNGKAEPKKDDEVVEAPAPNPASGSGKEETPAPDAGPVTEQPKPESPAPSTEEPPVENPAEQPAESPAPGEKAAE